MRLVIFDIDGTLTQTMKADEECFVRSLAEVCGFGDVDSDWSRYKHATDFGIFREIHETRTGRLPSPSETSRFREHFVALLARATSEVAFAAVTGAPLLLSRLADSEEHRVALATGAWLDSARLKMASAGLCYDDYPTASSDDAFDRESILRLSCEGQANDMANVAALFTLAMVFGTLARVATLAFHLLELLLMVVPPGCPRRVRFACSPI